MSYLWHPPMHFLIPNRLFARRLLAVVLLLSVAARGVRGEGDWEVTAESERALQLGLDWMAATQGPEGNWSSNDLGLVSMGALAFMAAGHAPGRGKYGRTIERAVNYVVANSRPSGLLNISNPQRDMYNHGLATFVLGQVHGMTTAPDRRLNQTLDQALKLIANTQCEDGGWDYRASRQQRGHDLSLAVMQAKALRSAVDSGLEVPPEVIHLAIRSVREHYAPASGKHNAAESEQRLGPGQFTYSKGGGGGTIAMAAAGVVCLQEFGQYDDWRIEKNMEVIGAAIKQVPAPKRNGHMPFDAYTLYYVGQALYQVGGKHWDENYPRLRDYLVASQFQDPKQREQYGSWRDDGANGGGKVGGRPGELYGTSVACFILAIPNRFLPILQEGRIHSLQTQFGPRDGTPALRSN